MENKQQAYRNLPQVEKLLQHEEIEGFVSRIGHGMVVRIIRRVIDYFREKIEGGHEIAVDRIIPSIVKNCELKELQKLQRVINGTGVIIHTNLGRAPLGRDIFESLKDMSGYCNLEFHLPSEKRGKRGGYAEELISELTSAEDALIVNNNAASVFLMLNQFASGKEVIVSRGELIQIGGGFRIPDIMKQSGATLVEVGTTNITDLHDYSGAISEKTSMIFSAHRSNYRIEGFSRGPSLKELAGLKNNSIVFVRDLGSGNLVHDQRLPRNFEHTIGYELSQGADLVSFSGDKLLGGCQAGIIVGRKDLISLLRKNPLMRMIRVDKITYFILQETLLKYINGNIEDVALWKMIFQDRKNISNRITRLMKRIKSDKRKDCIRRVNTRGTYGGGSMPAEEFESQGIRIDIPGIKPDELYSAFIKSPVPVVGSVVDDGYVLDFITILDDDITDLADSIDAVMDGMNRG